MPGQRENFSFGFSITTYILLSLLTTRIMSLVRYFSR
ncbi:MAG TPA: hypothetical protein DDY78_13245 [Planctomycetales bacterium]|nr:hypothetical protein [Planctomycetales bacterium]